MKNSLTNFLKVADEKHEINLYLFCLNGGVVGAVVRSLPSNHKVLGSNPASAEC